MLDRLDRGQREVGLFAEVRELLAFVRLLDTEYGFELGHADARTALEAIDAGGIANKTRVRYALRMVCCSKQEQIATFDRAFDRLRDGYTGALQATPARRALVLNLVAEPGETAGFSVERHIHVLSQHAPGFTVNEIVVDAARVPGEREREQISRTATILGATVQFADVSRPGTPLHDPARLAAALEGVRVRGMAPTPNISEPTVPTPTVNGPRGDDPWR